MKREREKFVNVKHDGYPIDLLLLPSLTVLVPKC